METDDCNGCSYISVESEDSSVERELCGNMEYPSVSTPNSQHTSPSRSLSANSIKVEQYCDDELGRVLQPCKPTVHMEESWNEEQGENLEEACSEPAGTCGYGEISSPKPASPGSNRLTNGKLKCDICGMICIGPNVLMVHKRSHTGERPFQCNQCGTSFTQKGNLLRHIKLHSGEKPFKCPFCSYACRRRDALTGHLRTHSVCQVKRYKCSSCGRGYKLQSTLDEHRERCHSYWQSLDAQTTNRGEHIGEKVRDTECMPDSFLQPSSDKTTFTDRLTNSITKRKRSTPQKFVEKSMRLNLAEASYELDSDRESEGMVAQHKSTECLYVDGAGGGAARSHTHRPLRHAPPHTPCLSELTPIISSMYTQLGPIGSRMDRPSEGPKEQQFVCNHVPSPSNGCQDSTDTESTAEEQSALPAERESLGVVDSEGQPVRCFRCRHCRIFFLDHVMFTIHMGCHGFRQPLECNICGHRSQDRYEFSSHIIRGEHKVG